MKRKIIKIFVGVFFIGALLFNISLNANIDKSNLQLSDLTRITFANAENVYEGYYNKTIVIYNYSGDLSVYVGSGKLPVGLTVNLGASGSLTYCESSTWWWKKCYESLNGFDSFS
jgi:hypothetical protein